MFPRRFYARRYFAQRYFSESSFDATWLEDVNTAHEIDASQGNVKLRLRAGVINTGNAVGGADFKWRYSKNSGAYADITASSSNVKTFDSTWFADGDDVPQSLTAGSYQSDNNAAEENTGAFSLAAGLAAGARFETEVALEVIAADLADDDTIDVQIALSDGTPLTTYSVTPRIVISKPPAYASGGLLSNQRNFLIQRATA